MSISTTLRFHHGLGDCVRFAHVLELYRRRGHEFALDCPPDKEILFRTIGTELFRQADNSLLVPWYDAGWWEPGREAEVWRYNKSAINVNGTPLPNIGNADEWWPELSEICLQIEPFLSAEVRQVMEDYLQELPRPIVLVQTKGDTDSPLASLSDALARNLYQHLLDNLDGTLILLDWNNSMPRLANWRVRHLIDDWVILGTEQFLALLCMSDCFIGVESGSLQAARLTDIPTIGLFPNSIHYPTRACLPRARQVNVVPRTTRPWNRKTRIAYNIVESEGESLDPRLLARICARMLAGPRYLGPGQIGADLQMQQFVLQWERGVPNHLTDYTDRHRSFDVLLREMSRRFSAPRVIETGCIRAEEDWQGAGYGTYLLGAYLQRAGGHLVTVDIDSRNCHFARAATHEMPCVSIVCQDSVAFLEQRTETIDVLYLDSVDTYSPMAISHALREIQVALPQLHAKSIVVFDDTVYQAGAFHGKGTEAVPWLLAQGWRIFYSGYQTICIGEESI